MRQGGSIRFPVSPIEIDYLNIRGQFIKAIEVHVHPIGVGARDVVRLYATTLAKIVLGDMCVERVGAKVFTACIQGKS